MKFLDSSFRHEGHQRSESLDQKAEQGGVGEREM